VTFASNSLLQLMNR